MHQVSIKTSRSYPNILEARMVMYSNFHTEDPQIFVASVRNLFSMETWHRGSVHPCSVVTENTNLELYIHCNTDQGCTDYETAQST
jgi:hypothetical protein